MERLKSKKFLTRKKIGSSFSCSPKQEPEVLMKSVIGDFVSNMLGGSLTPFMAYTSEPENLTAAELEELKKLVRELDKERKEKKQ